MGTNERTLGGRVLTGVVAGLTGGTVVAAALVAVELTTAADGPAAAGAPTTTATSPGPLTAGNSPSPVATPAPTVTLRPKPPLIRGTITVYERVWDRRVGGDMLAAPGDCWAGDGYDDISRGTKVTIYDEQQQVIGAGTLLRGFLVNVKREWEPGYPGVTEPHEFFSGHCRFTFEIQVSETADFYGVEVSHRGVVNIPAADLTSDHNRVTLSLG